LQYELLRDYVSPSDLKALVGLFIACLGKWDTFLYIDPVFNTVANMPFGVTDGSTLTFPITATYENPGGPGGAELIQNFDGSPYLSVERYGTLIEYPAIGARTNYMLESQAFTSPWAVNDVSVGGTGFPAPDGTTTSIMLTETTTTNVQHYISQGTAALAAGVYTFSIFAMAYPTVGGPDCRYAWIQLRDGTTTDILTVVYDLQLGVVSSTSISIGSTWTGPVPAVKATGQTPNWLRLSVAVTKVGANAVGAFVTFSNSASVATYSGFLVGCGCIWGAQFENTAYDPPLSINPTNLALPTMYIPTTTAAVTQLEIESIGPTGIVAINNANFGAIAGTKILWTGGFYYRCRFDDDNMDVSQFMQNFWELKKVKLRQVKL
jgi:hypothetical protein